MSMGSIGKAMKATRTKMIESETERIATEFSKRFGMRDGDYIRYRKTGRDWKEGRIMSVESVFYNRRGGFTADITVAPLLVSGKLGKTRSLDLCVNANGGGLKGVHFCDEVQRLSQSRSYV